MRGLESVLFIEVIRDGTSLGYLLLVQIGMSVYCIAYDDAGPSKVALAMVFGIYCSLMATNEQMAGELAYEVSMMEGNNSCSGIEFSL